MLTADSPEDLKSIEKCRNIVSEVLNYGVNQKEILKIIDLMSMELENTNIMKKIAEAINNNTEEKKQILL